MVGFRCKKRQKKLLKHTTILSVETVTKTSMKKIQRCKNLAEKQTETRSLTCRKTGKGHENNEQAQMGCII